MRVDKGALKSWLRTKIEALSITDLTPLYKYIVVLVTKDKPESELKAFCIEQLEELLGDKTADFVEEMFSVALTSSSIGDQVSSEKSHDDRSHRRAQDNPFDSNTLRAGSVNSNSRRPHNQNLPDSRRHHHEAHEYDPEDFTDRNTCHHRPRSDHSDQEDSEAHRARFSQRPERSRERGVRIERPRGGKPEDSEINRPPRRRCRNFDERGFCIYGDRCKYEHGSDALVIPGTTAAAWTAANLFDTALAATGTCLLPTAPSNGPSGLLDGGSDPLPTSSVEQDDDDAGGLPIYNPTPIVEALTRKPTHSFRSRSGAVNNKNIISIPTDNNAYEPSSSTPPAYEPARPEIADDGTSGSTHRRSTDEGAEQANPVPSANIASTVVTATDYTPSPISRQQQQCSLLVTKLPWRLNEPHRLREHFARFGNVVNIQTHFGGQNSQALVTYASVAEAEAAYRSPEPILSNRFIRLSLWPPSSGPLNATANGGVGRMASGGRFRGVPYKRHIDALGFSQFGHSLLGDAQPMSQRLPAKFRLGQVGDSVNFLKRGHHSSSNTTAASASKSTPNNRSRWRLERDENGNPVSGDEDDDDDDEEEVVDVETIENDGEADPRDDADEELSKKRFRPPDFDDIDDSFVRNRNSRNPNSGIDEETSDLMAAALQRKKALWERQKSNALKEHQAKLAQFEKQRAARQQIEAEKRALIIQLSAELKETVIALETVSNSETKRTLVAKAKGLCKRLEELRKSARCPRKRGDEAKQQNAVQQLLPDSVAAERLEKIAEVRQQLTELESRLQIEGSAEYQADRRKIADLKRRLVDLETIRPSDLAALNVASSLSIRGQTKLDKRPRVLYVTGHSTYDVEDFRQALAMSYLYTESFRPFICGNDKQPVIEITFCTRDFAEAAVRMFPQFHGRQLVMSFAPPASMTQEQQRQREEIEVRAEGAEDGGTSGDTETACGFSACVLDEELSVPVVDATVGDEFRSPKVKDSSSPRLR
ncbi:Zinc finger protein swm [Taenia crassiceps]|uniref:Zinc finger protein swm n=1 Tax=Taenia crassiceps TaxID=6207 RepID=A0ABR4QG12_9CEST